MEVSFTPEQVAHLAKIAAASGKDPEQLVQDIVSRTLADDARFREGVQGGIEQAERGEFVEEAEMDARVQRMLSR